VTTLSAPADVVVAGLTIDDDSGLIATGHASPRLSWKLQSAAADVFQLAYEVEVAASPEFDGPVARSGVVSEARPYLALWPAPPLQSREVRWWRVRAHTNLGLTAWSEPSRVEASLLSQSDWSARPVSPISNVGRETAGPVPLLRRAFEMGAPVVSARLYVTSLGVHEVQINGQPVSADLLEPGWSVYPKRLLFAAYDVTALLAEGSNAISAAVGDGWYRGDLTWKLTRNVYGATTALLAQLEVTLATGETVVVATDANWRGGYGAVSSADLYQGTETDLGDEPTGWRAAGFDDRGWEAVRVLDLPACLGTRAMPAVRIVERREIELPGQPSPGAPIRLDAGQNMTGYLRIVARGPAGARVTVRHAEVLDTDGSLFTEALREARATDSYMLDGQPVNELAPVFTFHGFRYAEIEASPGVTIDAVTAEVMSSDLRQIGRFACSDPMVNQLAENIRWSQRGNFLAVPTDCPQRDERLGWTGDIQVFSPTACLNADCRSFLGGWLRDLALEQDRGRVPHVIPDVLAQLGSKQGCAAWGDAATVVPWSLYRAYGDLEVLRAQFDSMKAWVDWCVTRTEPDGLWTRDFQFGDWLDPDAPPEKPAAAKTSAGFVASSYLAHSAGLVAGAATLVGQPQLAETYHELQARTALAAWTRWAEEAVRSPTGCALAIEFAIAPPSEHAGIGAWLAELVAAAGYRIGTGFVGTPLVLPALTRTGHLDVAYRLLMNRDCPGWLYQVDRGATTMWERWDGIGADGSPNRASMVSFNHYAYGAVGAWLYQTVAGLNVDLSQPPDAQIVLAPQPGGGLTWAEAELETPYGRLAIAWRLEGGTLTIDAVVPPGAVAQLTIPAGFQPPAGEPSIRLGAGEYSFRLSSSTTVPAHTDRATS
jgi:alpha-L-rhamnosidase